ncbi:Calponin repeat-containing protein [Strongyloides ratti]|uniref:Calponin repeat-containing protein n=1 Tax=Strongyloides ratti TaxID=34506 RepID=A0A090L3W8_STRRB|nr:Calponin repeat-containing protein [Strongyloides ratti]CEF62782.1 Calponin repeat-containing protein [Strongyloides ratti]
MVVNKNDIDTVNGTTFSNFIPSKLELSLDCSFPKSKNLVNFTLHNCYCQSTATSTRVCLLCSIKKLKRWRKFNNNENMVGSDKYLESIKKRNRIPLPNVIPWEAGTNKFSSQSGSLPFGCYRNIVPNIYLPPHLTLDDKRNDELIIPYLTCPPLHPNSFLSSQKGCPPFGSFRKEICSVTYCDNKIKVEDLLSEDKKKNSSILPKIFIPPEESKNDTIFGKFRELEVKSHGNGGVKEMSKEDKLKCNSVIKKIDDPRDTVAEIDKKQFKSPLFQSFYKGDNNPDEKKRKADEYHNWMGGQLTIHSTYDTNNIKKSSNKSYYDKLMSEKDMTGDELYHNKAYNLKTDTDMINKKITSN